MGKKNPVGWKRKYQSRSKEIAEAIRTRDAALEAHEKMKSELEEHQALFDMLKDNFGTDALTIFNNYTSKMEELEALKTAAEEESRRILNDAREQANTEIGTAEMKAGGIVEEAEKTAAVIIAAAEHIQKDVEAEVQRRFNEVKGALDEREAQLDTREEEANTLFSTIEQREADVIDSEKNVDMRILEAQRIEQYIKDTEGDASMKKMRKRLYAAKQELEEVKMDKKALASESKKMNIVIGLLQQQGGRQRDTISRQGEYIKSLRAEKGIEEELTPEELFKATATPEEIDEHEKRKAEHEKMTEESKEAEQEMYDRVQEIKRFGNSKQKGLIAARGLDKMEDPSKQNQPNDQS